jgi:hypothetical protein
VGFGGIKLSMNNDMEKYKELIGLLKHQDSQINSFLTWNVVIQGGLLVAMQLDIVADNRLFLLGLELLGIILAFFWILSGKRLKSYTDYYIERLKDFEKVSNELKDFRLFTDGEAKTKQSVSKILY